MSTNGRAHLTLLDPLRILASVAVVYSHVRDEYLFGLGFGLFLFLIIMFALATSSTKREPLFAFARRKGSFLLLPWLRWSLIYVLFFAARDLLWGRAPWASLRPDMLLYGGHGFLWFLPFAAFALIPMKAMQILLRRLSPTISVIGASAAGIALTHGSVLLLEMGPPIYPIDAWITAVPALAWGLAVGQAMKATGEKRRVLLLVTTLASYAAFRFTPMQGSEAFLFQRYALAVPLASLGFGWRPPIPRAVSYLATLTFGVYLVHCLVWIACQRILDIDRWPASMSLAMVWVGSALLVYALRMLSLPWAECRGPERRMHPRPSFA